MSGPRGPVPDGDPRFPRLTAEMEEMLRNAELNRGVAEHQAMQQMEHVRRCQFARASLAMQGFAALMTGRAADIATLPEEEARQMVEIAIVIAQDTADRYLVQAGLASVSPRQAANQPPPTEDDAASQEAPAAEGEADDKQPAAE